MDLKDSEVLHSANEGHQPEVVGFETGLVQDLNPHAGNEGTHKINVLVE